MNILSTVILGVVQGLTEFIPVSSSGHLVVIENLLKGVSDPHLFIQSLSLGTTLALIIYFRKRILAIFRQVFINHDYRLLRNIVLTCIPVATIGLLLADLIETSSFASSSLVVAIAMASVGSLMIFLDKLPRLSPLTDGSKLNPLRAIWIGLAQCVALIPGVSRSGSTIIAAELMGLKPKPATEYSFIVSIPVMIGLTGKLLISDLSFIATNWSIILVGNIFAFIAGLIAIRYLLNYLSSHNLVIFGYYRLAAAGLIILLLTTNIIPK